MGLKLVTAFLMLSFFKGVTSGTIFTANVCESQGGPFNCGLFQTNGQHMFIDSFQLYFIGYSLQDTLDAFDYASNSNACYSVESSGCSTLVDASNREQFEEFPDAVARFMRHIMDTCHSQSNCTVQAPDWLDVDTNFNSGPCQARGQVGFLAMDIYFECGFPTTTTTTTTTSTTTTTVVPPSGGASIVLQTEAVTTASPQTVASTTEAAATTTTTTISTITTKSTDAPVPPEGEGGVEKQNNDSTVALPSFIIVALTTGLSLWLRNNL